jgi:GNAT superfamily N-acetyltransferase
MPDSKLEVSLLKPEEASQYMRVRHETFKPTVNHIFYSRGEASQKTLDRVTSDIQDAIVNKGLIYVKCVDTTTGEIVAGARWHCFKAAEGAKERTQEDLEADSQVPKPYDESDPDMVKAFYDLTSSNRKDIMGTRPYYSLDTLVTLPKHERRGAGSMLVRWGCEKADEAGVEAYLEASPLGVPLYSRHGFERVRDVELDLRKWGGTEVMPFVVSIQSLGLRQSGSLTE